MINSCNKESCSRLLTIIKLLLCFIVLFSIAQTATAKTISLMCETMSAGSSPVTTGPGSQFTGRDASYSTWSVIIETDDNGKIIKVNADDAEKEFELKGDLLKFRGKLLASLEINLKTGRARTTITGFDTREQGGCKVVSKTDGNLLN